MRVLLVLSLLIISVNGFHPWECMNNGTHFEADQCSYAKGQCGQQCKLIQCVAGLHNIMDINGCTWLGRVCNVTKESIWHHGGLVHWGQCLCVSGWSDDKCDKIHCSGLYSEVSDIQCQTQPCKNCWITELLWVLSLALRAAGCVVFAMAGFYFASS